MRQPSDPVLAAWAGSLRARSEHTARSYGAAAERFLGQVGKPVDQLTVTDALVYVGELSGSGLSRGSVATYISGVRSFLRHCQQIGLLPQTPLDVLRRPRVAITSLNRYLDIDEAKELLEGARMVGPAAHVAVAVLLATGLRVQELAGAQWRHLFRDPQGGLGLLVVHGKGGKERVVAVRDDLWQVLVADRRRRSLPAELSSSDISPLVADRDGTAPSSSTVWRWVRRAALAARLAKADVSPHWLRHTFGTLTAIGGASVFQIQAAMGHSRIDTSQRYIHWARGVSDCAAHLLPLDIR